MTDTTSNLTLPFLLAAQAQKHVTLNESLLRLDALVQASVESATTTAQPASPADGQCYILPTGKSGTDWAGMGIGQIAYYRDGVWEALSPREGWRVYVRDSNVLRVFDGSAWQPLNAATADQWTTARTLTLSGDLTGAVSIDGSAAVGLSASLAASGVTAGTYCKLTVDAKGRATAGAALASGDVTGALGYTPVNKAGDTISGNTTVGGSPPTAGRLGVVGAASGVSLALSDNANCSLYFKHVAGGVQLGTDSGGQLRLCSNGFNDRLYVETAGHVRPGADNTQNLGSASYRWATVYAATGTINTSDLREKTDITPLALGLDFICALNPIAFKYTVGGYDVVSEQTGATTTLGADGTLYEVPVVSEHHVPRPGTRVHFGFGAQDIKAVLDQAGVSNPAMWTLADASDPESRQGLRESHLIAVLVKAVQELAARVTALEATL